jgi:predicted GNAT family N-acyltransferase
MTVKRGDRDFSHPRGLASARQKTSSSSATMRELIGAAVSNTYFLPIIKNTYFFLTFRSMSVTVQLAIYSEVIQTIRREVFQREQGVSEELEFDGLDESAEHLLADRDGVPVGTARIRRLNEKTVKIERLAVLISARGLGIGRKLMEEAIAVARGYADAEEIVINAQEYVTRLYEKLGFEVVGDRFEEAGIPHVKMKKIL